MLTFSPAAAVCLVICLICAALHLFYPKHKNFTKALLLPSIALFYAVASEKTDPVVIAAFIMSWIGDIVIEFPGDKWFVAGGISFMLSHFLFITAYALNTDFKAVSVMPVIAASAVYLAACILLIRYIRPGAPEKMTVPLFLYIAINAVMNIFAFMRFLAAPSVLRFLTFAGAILFFISDCVLFYGNFRNEKKIRTFYPCMGTYISGELLIAVGLLIK